MLPTENFKPLQQFRGGLLCYIPELTLHDESFGYWLAQSWMDVDRLFHIADTNKTSKLIKLL